MINLLPPQQKEELSQEKKWKQILILAIVFSNFLICFSLILYSININISNQAAIQKIVYQERKKEIESEQMVTLRDKLANFNQTISQADSFYEKQFNFTELLEKISTTLSSGIYLTNLSINPAKEQDKFNCNLSGFSPTREILLEFKQNLEKEQDFEQISFPPASWVEPADINFSVTFTVK